MDKLEKIFEECIGLNAELGYVPIKKEDVIEAIKRAYNQALEDVKENVTLLIENEYNTFIKGNFAYISESGEHFEIDKESVDKLKIK